MSGSISDENKRILIVTAVEAERDAVRRGLEQAGAANKGIDAIAVGVGPAAAAAGTAAALALASIPYAAVISAGIGGGFAERVQVGGLVLATSIVAADLGAESPDGFISLDELGFGTAAAPVSDVWNVQIGRALTASGISAVHAPIITVTTATGTAHTAALREKVVPGAAAEGMEGHGVAAAAARMGVPATELRAISNPVGPRDRAAWRIGDALKALEAASRALALGLK
ncbi:futalosine hydrolase [Paenibacillus sp. GCM10027627]|uniref:futalosine hydrolase n=1 Tax=unclassified Paenibacillus TaxID=185978 RepID=UPI00363BFB07